MVLDEQVLAILKDSMAVIRAASGSTGSQQGCGLRNFYSQGRCQYEHTHAERDVNAEYN